MSADLIELVHKLGQPRVLVVGDLMLDRYVWGDAARISQEAPVVLLRADRREERLGGASSVATMLRALGAKVLVAGAVGDDADGGRVREMLAELSINLDGVLTVTGRPTTVKERYIGRAQHRHPQQMLRVDYEVTTAVPREVEARLCQWAQDKVPLCDVVLVSDYDKGVCTPNLLAAVIAAARARGTRVLVDPLRGPACGKYRGCSAVTPNRLEAGLITGSELRSPEEVLAAGEKMLAALELEAAVITLDKDGMALAHRDGRRAVLPTRPRQVYDITGAGDMVLAMLGMALAAGADYEDAIALANIAGGLEVEKIGAATVSRDEILRDLLRGDADGRRRPAAGGKVLPLDELCREAAARRALGQKVVFTNGCYDLLHAGHVAYLRDARAQGDLLVVGVNSDAGVRRLKGPERPINPLEARLQVLTSLEAVDFVTVFEDETPIDVIRALRPDVLVKGADYRKDQVVGADLVESYGGRVYLAPLQQGYSTTRLIEQLRAA